MDLPGPIGCACAPLASVSSGGKKLRIALIVAVTWSVLLAAGCGGEELTAEKTAQFGKALEQYLKEGSMGMKIDSFEGLEVSGDSATAKVRMALKEELYKGLKPLWTVTFKKAAGAWKVVSVRKQGG